ncbi:Insertion sequence IS5376 putative ATP-binding protein [Koleobacter methoxysyntrophicus]|uniref:Insertion sequence IS5376 putative ATP-binding protein n=1 Tax=Koleobacter methoxysyntrophicus TaxID=2751313 RepID=A0A8A0RKU9_9FIRM|nr:IS21-like element helper ATPase IstB [Koleobacter methoxysyntrophicus]QSQ08248.1 Insertion sequence IS5376 putative ATP-binding protein [Koleobacter methoxysyntrophicus]
MRELILKHCHTLKLGSRIAENYKTIEAETHEEFLEKLLAMEVKAREINRKNLLIKKACFDVIKTFENYSFEQIEIPGSISIEAIKTVSFVDKKENLILYGPVGTGKTHLATAIGVEACQRKKRVQFFRTAALVNQLLDVKANGELKKFMRRLEKLDLLICDEWGYIPFDREGAQLLFQVISDCYERKSLIITTNLEFSKWNGIFYDEKLTSAIIDRVIHHSHLLIFTGSSYRLKNSTINC